MPAPSAVEANDTDNVRHAARTPRSRRTPAPGQESLWPADEGIPDERAADTARRLIDSAAGHGRRASGRLFAGELTERAVEALGAAWRPAAGASRAAVVAVGAWHAALLSACGEHAQSGRRCADITGLDRHTIRAADGLLSAGGLLLIEPGRGRRSRVVRFGPTWPARRRVNGGDTAPLNPADTTGRDRVNGGDTAPLNPANGAVSPPQIEKERGVDAPCLDPPPCLDARLPNGGGAAGGEEIERRTAGVMYECGHCGEPVRARPGDGMPDPLCGGCWRALESDPAKRADVLAQHRRDLAGHAARPQPPDPAGGGVECPGCGEPTDPGALLAWGRCWGCQAGPPGDAIRDAVAAAPFMGEPT